MFLKHAILIYGLLRLSDYPVASNFFRFSVHQFASGVRILAQAIRTNSSKCWKLSAALSILATTEWHLTLMWDCWRLSQ